MVTLTVPQIYFLFPSRLVGDLNFPAISPTLAVGVRPRGRRKRRRPPPTACVNLQSGSFGLGHLKRRHYYAGSWCCWCKGWESEGDSMLEAEILEFMKGSEKPEVFPTKQELVNAGRMDLVEAIEKKGGWLSLGWDLGNDNEEVEAQEIDIAERNSDDKRVNAQGNGRFGARSDGVLVGEIVKDFQQRVESRQQSNSFNTGNRVGHYGVSSVPAHPAHSPSSSGSSL